MALGEMKMFQFKSKEQRDKEAKEYAHWAFPYGDLQRDNLNALIKELVPKAYLPVCLTAFLTCKELYEKALEKSETQEEAVNHMLNTLKGHEQLLRPAETPLYLALVLADAYIDESCVYPSADSIRLLQQELSDMRVVRPGLFGRKRK